MKRIAAADNQETYHLPDEYFLGEYLQRALGDISNPNWHTVNENRKLFEWFKSPVEDGVTTFRGIISALKFRPSTVKRIVLLVESCEKNFNERFNSDGVCLK